MKIFTTEIDISDHIYSTLSLAIKIISLLFILEGKCPSHCSGIPEIERSRGPRDVRAWRSQFAWKFACHYALEREYSYMRPWSCYEAVPRRLSRNPSKQMQPACGFYPHVRGSLWEPGDQDLQAKGSLCELIAVWRAEIRSPPSKTNFEVNQIPGQVEFRSKSNFEAHRISK